MDKKNIPDILEQIAEAALEALKKREAKGGDLTADALIKAIKRRKEITTFFSEQASQAETIHQLEEQNKQALSRKDKLLKQMETLEDRSAKAAQFYRQALSTFIYLAGSTDNPSLQESLDTFRQLLQEDTDIALLSEALTRLKQVAFEGDLHAPAPPPPKKGSSFFGKFLKSGEPETPPLQAVFMQHLKTAYQDILDQLRLHMGEGYLEKLSSLGRQIRQGEVLDDFFDIRQDILSLISDYINHVSAERELTAEFIREIGKRLIELESYLLESLTASDSQNQSHQEFNILLEKQLGDLRNSVDFSKTLTELKEAVVSKLEIINQALENKRQQDSVHLTDTQKKMSRLQQHLIEMKEKISSANKQSQKLEQELLRDPLTGANNRRAYDRAIENEMSRFLRYKRPFSLMLLDVDHFKKVNDTYGHAIGDKCLTEIIKRIRPALRDTDFLARYGGEEFIVILPETSGDIARQAAERLRGIVAGIDFLHKKETVNITISIGVSQVLPTDKTHETVFQRTDRALYRAKNSGRNRVVLDGKK